MKIKKNKKIKKFYLNDIFLKSIIMTKRNKWYKRKISFNIRNSKFNENVKKISLQMVMGWRFKRKIMKLNRLNKDK